MKFIAPLLLGIALIGADLVPVQAVGAAAGTLPDPASVKWRKDKRIAKKLLKKNDTETAVPYLEAGAKKKAKKAYFAQKLAPAYLALRDYKSSNKWYKVLMDRDSARHKSPIYTFQFALTQKYLGQYEDAMVTFARYRKMAGDDDESTEMKKRATREIAGCQRGIFYRDSVPSPAFKVKHLEVNINQPLADFSPVIRDGALYYSSVRGDKSPAVSRIFKSIKTGNDWTPGEPLSDDINVPGKSAGNPAFTPDGNTMYYTLCTEDAMHKVMCQIYKSAFANGVWEAGKSVGESVNDPAYSNTQPAVGKNKDNEDVVYFVSDRNPGKGLDIFSSKINMDGSLGKPRSAGPQINTKGDEMSPYFDFKSKTLYFSSNGWINIGGMDVYKTTWDPNGEWTEPENMGMPINSSTDDVYFSINDLGTLGFEVSNRPGGLSLKSETCCDDIYQVETTKLFLAVHGQVYEETDGNRTLSTDALVQLYDERNGTELSSYHLINGGFFFDLEPKRGYRLVTRRDGFYDGIAPFNTDNNTSSDTMKYDLFLKKKPEPFTPLIGRTIGTVYYDYDKTKLRDDSHDTLRAVMDILNQYPNIVLEVGAHTDGKGTEDYNVRLSQKRADAVANYFIYEKKVEPERLVKHAFGTSQPAAPNKKPDGSDDPAGRALNRRTEFKIIKELAPGWREEKKAEAESKKTSNKKEETITPPAKVVKRDMTGKTTGTGKTAAPAAAPAPKAATPAPKPKAAKDDASAAPKVEVRKEAKKTDPNTEGAYKNAPSETVIVKGNVYTEKGGTRTLVTSAAVFLTTSEGGFQQKVYYVKGDGGYNFDISRSSSDTYKLVARKYQYESNEVIFTLDDIKASNKPIDLVIKMD